MKDEQQNPIRSQYVIWDNERKSGSKSAEVYRPVPVSEWCKDDQPRYKMLYKGKGALSDAETLSIILGGGSPTGTSLDLAKRILQSANNNLAIVSRLSVAELIRIKGIGQAKATSVVAAFEIGRRKNLNEVLAQGKISNSKDAYELLKSTLDDKPYEEFWIVLLNKANKVIRTCNISEGGIAGTVVDPKKIFKIALDHHASSIILGHNHPSGNIQPSEADNKITRKIQSAGDLLDISVLDHIIVGSDGYYSYADSGAI